MLQKFEEFQEWLKTAQQSKIFFLKPEHTNLKFFLVSIIPITSESASQITLNNVRKLFANHWEAVEGLKFFYTHTITGRVKPLKAPRKKGGIRFSGLMGARPMGDVELTIRDYYYPEKELLKGKFSILFPSPSSGFYKHKEKLQEKKEKIIQYCKRIQKKRNRRGRKLKLPPELKKAWEDLPKALRDGRDGRIFYQVYIAQSYTQTEMAEIEGLTKGRVSQICKKILAQILK